MDFFSYIRSRKLALLITALYTTVLLVVLINRFLQYEVFYYDHGYTEAAAWQASHFKVPLWDREGRTWAFTDHVYPSLLLIFAPIYWFTDSYLAPVIMLAILIGASVLIGYEIGYVLKINKLMLWALLFAYMFYIGLQNAEIFFLKDITVSIPFLMLLFLSIVKKKIKLFYVLLILNLGFKETNAVMGFTLGIGLFLFGGRFWKKYGLFTVLISTAYAFFVTKLVVPYAMYQSFGTASNYGFNPEFSANPFSYVINLVNTPQKRETIFTSLSTFGFLPLFSPLGFLLTLQDFAQRFVLIGPFHPLRQGLNLHYNASLAVILFFSSVLAVKRLKKSRSYRGFLTFHAFLIVVIVATYHQFIYHGPLGLIYNKDFTNITKNMKFINDFVAMIPKDGKLMIQNNLAVRFTHNDLYILSTEKYFRKVEPDVLVLDFHPGQNPNNFWPMTEDKMASLAAQLKKDPTYKALFQETHRYIFVKY